MYIRLNWNTMSKLGLNCLLTPPSIAYAKNVSSLYKRIVLRNVYSYSHLFFSWLVSGRNSLSPAIWLVPGAGGNFRSCPLTERFRPASSLCDKIELPYSKKKINKLFTGFGSVRIVKNCDLGLENAALGLRPQAAFSRPRSQFFTIRTDPKPVNNIYILSWFIKISSPSTPSHVTAKIYDDISIDILILSRYSDIIIIYQTIFNYFAKLISTWYIMPFSSGNIKIS